MGIGGNTDGINPDFLARLDQLSTVCNVTVGSGFRSTAEQEALYQKYLAGQGPLAAKPGTSNHERGLAVDLDGDKACANAHGPQFGLHFPVAGEDWHVEPVDTDQLAQHVGADPGGSTFTTTQGEPLATQPSNYLPTVLASIQAAVTGQDSSIESMGSKLSAMVNQPAAAAAPGAAVLGGPGGSGAPGPVGQSGGNWEAFARDLLTALGAPATPEMVDAFLTIMRFEQQPESPNAAYNPLNIQSGNYDHASVSGGGQYNFSSWEQGIQQTASFLQGSNYDSVRAALMTGNPTSFLDAWQNSPWAGGHYNYVLPGEFGSTQANRDRYANGIIGTG